jgi:ribonuclease-3
MHSDRVGDLEVLLGHAFRERNLLENALSHSSIKSQNRPSNERLEFLGDSVLGLIVSDVLYRRFPTDDEGTLTRIKSHAVSRATLQRIAVAMGLDRYILVGKGVSKREIPASLLGNLFEAIVGAIYLDSGLSAVRKFVLRHLDVVIHEIVEDRAERNYKSLFQHYCQRDLGGVPSYRVLRESGPAHSRAFEVAVHVNGKEYGRARAASKKEAEQGAARAAMIFCGQVDEKATQSARGAGTILRVGPEGSGRRGKKRGKRGRGGRGGAPPEARPAPPVPIEEDQKPAHTPARERKSSRRSRRRAREKEAEAAPAQAPEPTPPAPEPAKAAPEEPAKKTRKTRKKSAKKKKKTAAGKKRKKKATRKPAEEKETSGGDADAGTGGGGTGGAPSS